MEENYSNEDFIRLARLFLAPNYAPFPVTFDSASGSWIWDTDGKQYVDMMSGYSALNLGYDHPRIARAMREQFDKLSMCSRKFLSREMVLFAKELAEFCGMEMVLPMNTGAEAVETAIKLARKWAYTRKGVPINKAEIIVCENNFHGRTTTISSASSIPQYKDLFGPLTPGFIFVPFGDADALLEKIRRNTAAFLVEPIQGEGGIIVPPKGYLKECRKICLNHNVLFMADEVQTGFARTGTMFACDYESVKPDLFTLGKALGGGMIPISAVVGSRELLEVFQPADHGSTFGGNPLACHVAREVLKVLKDERIAEKAFESGRYLTDRLRAIPSPYVKEIRGRGLMIGIELKKGGPNAHEICSRLIQAGVVCSDTKEYVVRIAPALTIRKFELDWALERIEKVLTT